MEQPTNVSVQDLISYANCFGNDEFSELRQENSKPHGRGELVEIFYDYNRRKYSFDPTGPRGTTKCCATGTCYNPIEAGVIC